MQVIYIPSANDEIRKENAKIVIEQCMQFLMHFNITKPQLDLKINMFLFELHWITAKVYGCDFHTTFNNSAAAGAPMVLRNLGDFGEQPNQKFLQAPKKTATPRGAREVFVSELNKYSEKQFKGEEVFDKEGKLILTSGKIL